MVITCRRFCYLKESFPIAELLLCTGLRTLSTVLGTGLHYGLHALCIESTTDDVVTNTGQILNTTATDQNNAVLLQVMADTRNVRGDLDTIRQRRTRAILRRAELGFLGVMVRNGSANTSLLGAAQVGVLLLLGVVALLQAGAVVLYVRTSRPLRTSWLKVGIFFLLS